MYSRQNTLAEQYSNQNRTTKYIFRPEKTGFQALGLQLLGICLSNKRGSIFLLKKAIGDKKKKECPRTETGALLDLYGRFDGHPLNGRSHQHAPSAFVNKRILASDLSASAISTTVKA